MTADEDAAIDLIMSEMNNDDNPLDETQQRESYEILMTKMTSDDEDFLEMTDSKWENIISWMETSKLIDSTISVSDVIIDR